MRLFGCHFPSTLGGGGGSGEEGEEGEGGGRPRASLAASEIALKEEAEAEQVEQ